MINKDMMQDVYSTEEVKTNKVWIDGKPIYRKTIYYNNPMSSGTNLISHNINNIGTHKIVVNEEYLIGIYSYGKTLESANTYIGTTNIDNTYVTVSVGSNWNNTFSECYITLEYTKTTD